MRTNLIFLILIVLTKISYCQGTTQEINFVELQKVYTKFFNKEQCSFECFKLGYIGYQKLKADGILANSRYLTLVDFSFNKYYKRLFVLNMDDTVLEINSVASHGKNSEFKENIKPKYFSNDFGSLKSSLGFYITGNQYERIRNGDNLSMCLFGLDSRYNSNACKRNIIMHYGFSLGKKQEYVTETKAGNAWGCVALPKTINTQIIQKIKGGSVLFIYSPLEKLFSKFSSVLNDKLNNKIIQQSENCKCNLNKLK